MRNKKNQFEEILLELTKFLIIIVAIGCSATMIIRLWEFEYPEPAAVATTTAATEEIKARWSEPPSEYVVSAGDGWNDIAYSIAGCTPNNLSKVIGLIKQFNGYDGEYPLRDQVLLVPEEVY